MDKIIEYISKNKIKLLAYSYWIFFVFIFIIDVTWIWSFNWEDYFFTKKILHWKIVISIIFPLSLFFSWKYFLEIFKEIKKVNDYLKNWKNNNYEWAKYALLYYNNIFNDSVLNKSIDDIIYSIKEYLKTNIVYFIPWWRVSPDWILDYNNSFAYFFIDKEIKNTIKQNIEDDKIKWEYELFFWKINIHNMFYDINYSGWWTTSYTTYHVEVLFSKDALYISLLFLKNVILRKKMLYLFSYLFIMLLIQFTAIWKIDTILKYINFYFLIY